MATSYTRRLGLGGLAAAVMLLTGCEAQLREGASFSISDFISGVTDASGTVQATLQDGAAPTPGSGPAASVSGISVMINGGSGQQTVSGASAFTRVIVSVEGLNDYYELTLPSGVSSEGVLISLSQRATAGNMYMLYAVGDAGTVGTYARQALRVLQVGSGDIQISASWTDSADVDLHVFDPSGEEIYFGHKTAASGGTLDLDANAACSPNESSPRVFYSNENVVWSLGTAPNGTYQVVLDYWSDCGVAQTDWVVTIQRQGAQPQIFTGTFTGPSSGVPDAVVSSFTY
jgi:hypothetical protein